MEERASVQEATRKAQEATRRLEERARETMSDAARNAGHMAGFVSETNSTWAEAGGKLFDELMQLSTSAAKENARVMSELQQLSLDGLREMQHTAARWQRTWPSAFSDPWRWWQSLLEDTVQSAQRSVSLTQRTAELLSDACRRVQGTAEQSGKVLEETLRGASTRMQELYARGQRSA
jgi:gas vesicle protein